MPLSVKFVVIVHCLPESYPCFLYLEGKKQIIQPPLLCILEGLISKKVIIIIIISFTDHMHFFGLSKQYSAKSLQDFRGKFCE